MDREIKKAAQHVYRATQLLQSVGFMRNEAGMSNHLMSTKRSYRNSVFWGSDWSNWNDKKQIVMTEIMDWEKGIVNRMAHNMHFALVYESIQDYNKGHASDQIDETLLSQLDRTPRFLKLYNMVKSDPSYMEIITILTEKAVTMRQHIDPQVEG